MWIAGYLMEKRDTEKIQLGEWEALLGEKAVR